ncbi:MAG: ABC transporter substrate-binding protein [Gammaproteobacteria bacterium]|nr:ABC transporter substrate-binding protein [Gammaproteobacteria bacterium]MDH3536892.1 ABC transporter substrate-binding protein [Gammaproteobacteria bacterium]
MLAALIMVGSLLTGNFSSASAADKVVMQIGWDHQFTYAGFYAAQWQGYYEAADLEVEIRSAITPERKILQSAKEVAEGRAEFGTAAADFLIMVDQGAPLVLLASLFQQSPAGFFAKKGAGLTSPADLVQLRVSRRINDMLDVEMQSMLLAEGIDPAKVKAYPRERSLTGLTEGRVDVIPGFLPLRLWQAQQLGIKVDVLRPISYGIDFYGNSLITHRHLVESNPELVTRFVDASLQGWVYALDHPDEIADRIANDLQRIFPLDEPEAFNRFEAEQIRKLMLFPIVPVGNINPERWQRMQEHLLQVGVVKKASDIKQYIFDPKMLADARTERLLNALKIGISVLVIIVLAFFAIIWLLRSLVGRRTEELRHLIGELEAKNMELERFVYTASHELKSPLVTISGFTGLLDKDLKEGDTEKLKHDIQRITSATAIMSTLLENLLELSRISRFINPPEEVPLGELVQDVMSFMLPRLTGQHVKITVLPDLPRVYGDRVRLRELLRNLIENAIKFRGDQAELQVEIGARDNGAEVICHVRDNGNGIDRAYHEKIFGLFERLDAEIEGTGIGLSLARRIVELHGGRIWVESGGPDRGSTFFFTIPKVD